MGKLNPYAKAIIGGLVPAAAMFANCAADEVVTLTEWGWVVGAALSGFLAVWAVPNTPAPPE